MINNTNSEYFKEHKEADFEEDVRNDLKGRNLLVIKMPCSLEKSIILPDLLVISPKKVGDKLSGVFFIELKTPNGRLSKIQQITNKFLSKYVDVFVVYGWDDYYKALEKVLDDRQ